MKGAYDNRNVFVLRHEWAICPTDSGEITLKSGCLNTTDSRSRVGECTLSPGLLAGGVPYTERFCICTSDRCNGGLLGVGVSLVLFTTAAILFAL
jgi:hypothetical protein